MRNQEMLNTDDLIPDEGIEGTSNFRKYDFKVAKRGRKGTLTLQFIDYPGGWLEEEASPNQLSWVENTLRESDGILLPIDSPALMEKAGFWHHSRNRPDFMYDILQRVFEDLQSPRLLVLAPIRCQLYLQSAAHVLDLLERVEEGYSKLLGHMTYFQDYVAVVVTPVQTLGEIVFNRLSKNEYIPFFHRIAADAQYSTQDTEQPLRFRLRFAMRLYHDTRQGGYFSLIRKMFKQDEYLINAANAFAAGCKLDQRQGFKVIRGHDWLSA